MGRWTPGCVCLAGAPPRPRVGGSGLLSDPPELLRVNSGFLSERKSAELPAAKGTVGSAAFLAPGGRPGLWDTRGGLHGSVRSSAAVSHASRSLPAPSPGTWAVAPLLCLTRTRVIGFRATLIQEELIPIRPLTTSERPFTNKATLTGSAVLGATIQPGIGDMKRGRLRRVPG